VDNAGRWVSARDYLLPAISSPISVLHTAGKGSAWGIALLGSYLVTYELNLSLDHLLDDKVFAGHAGLEISPTAYDVARSTHSVEDYQAGLPVEEAATRFQT